MDIGILILLGVLATFAAGLGAHRLVDGALERPAANGFLLLALTLVLALTTVALVFVAAGQTNDGL